MPEYESAAHAVSGFQSRNRQGATLKACSHEALVATDQSRPVRRALVGGRV